MVVVFICHDLEMCVDVLTSMNRILMTLLRYKFYLNPERSNHHYSLSDTANHSTVNH